VNLKGREKSRSSTRCTGPTVQQTLCLLIRIKSQSAEHAPDTDANCGATPADARVNSNRTPSHIAVNAVGGTAEGVAAKDAVTAVV
jgi:hypothetical protein